MVDRGIFMYRLSYTFTVEYEQPILDMHGQPVFVYLNAAPGQTLVHLPHRMYMYGPVECSVSLEFCTASSVDVGLH